jgi:hypothetical protein
VSAKAYDHAMIRWLLVIFLALIFISWFTPLLQKLGVGKLPGDFRFRLFGREWFLPVASTVVLSLVAGLISKVV